MKKLFLLMLAFIAAHDAFANILWPKTPITALNSQFVKNNLITASSNSIKDGNERCGFIYVNNSGEVAMSAVSIGTTRGCPIPATNISSKNLLAFWHTHPSYTPMNNVCPSQDDINIAKANSAAVGGDWGPAYIVVLPGNYYDNEAGSLNQCLLRQMGGQNNKDLTFDILVPNIFIPQVSGDPIPVTYAFINTLGWGAQHDKTHEIRVIN